jgi:hypothetical protein
MSNKTLRNLLIIFLFLLIIFLIKNYFSLIFPKSSLYQKNLAKFKKEEIYQIEISKKNEKKLTLSKRDNNYWQVDGKRANQNLVDEFLNAVFAKDNPEIIAQTEKKHQELEVNEDLGYKVVLNQNLSFFLGKFSYPGVCLRFEGQNEVFFVKGFSSYLVSLDLNDWVDKTIFSQDKEKIKSIEIKKAKKEIKLVKKDKDWILEGAKEEKIEKEKIDSILGEISSLVAVRIFEESDLKVYLGKPEIEIYIGYEGGEEKLKIFEGEDDYLVERGSDKEKFILGKYSISTLIKFFEKGN